MLLTENDVIDAVVLYLKNRGWCVESVSYTNQRGYDVLAKKGKKSLAIEAKGGTSSKNNTARYKKIVQHKPENGSRCQSVVQGTKRS